MEYTLLFTQTHHRFIFFILFLLMAISILFSLAAIPVQLIYVPIHMHNRRINSIVFSVHIYFKLIQIASCSVCNFFHPLLWC